MNTLASIASIGVGATVGASCRYYIGVLSIQYLGKAFPYGTLISNVVGSFIAGILVVVILEKLLLSETYRLMLLVGLTGSLTTMSTLSFESLEMLSGGKLWPSAFEYFVEHRSFTFSCWSWCDAS